MFGLEMLSAIDLNDEAGRVTHEINNERADWRLTSKARAAKPVGADRVPDDFLGVSRIPPQRACVCPLFHRHVPTWWFR
jgi:hypothetical protein